MTQREAQLSKNHHYVPQFYLKRFTNAQGKVWDTWRAEDGQLQEKARSTKSIACEEHLYSSQRMPFRGTDELEDSIESEFLSIVDSQAALALDSLIAGPTPLTADQAKAWSRFISSMLARTPERLKVLKGQLESVRAESLNDMFARTTDREHLQEVLDDIDMDGAMKQLGLHLMAQEADDKETIDYLATFDTVVMSLSIGFELPTVDAPVVVNMGKDPPIHFYTMSLSPEHLLFAWPGGGDPLDTDVAKQAIFSHCIALLSQSSHVYTRDPLVDGIPLKMRGIAESVLPKLPWRKR